jgi:hypothetical protein
MQVAAGQAPVNVARTGTASAPYTPAWLTVGNLTDGVAPTGPRGPDTDVWNTWPQVGDQWIQLDWAAPVTVDRTRIWFTSDLDDSGAGVAPPGAWRLQYWDGTAFRDVTAPGAYGTSATGWNTVTFDPVTTTRLRALLTAAGTEEGKGAPGVQEWEVYDVPATPPDTDVEVQARARCTAGKAHVAVTARNTGDVPRLRNGGDTGLVTAGEEVVTVLDQPTQPGNNVGLVDQELLVSTYDSAEVTGGAYTVDAGLTLRTPADVAAGSYRSTLTLSLFE